MSASPRLRLVPAPAERDAAPDLRFCGSCGMAPEHDVDPGARVCGRCGMGILLEAHPDTAPKPDEPFFIVDGRLTICAVSLAAEELLGIEEVSAVTRQLSDYLVPADAEALGPEPLIHSVIMAASDPGPPQTVVVRPAGEFGVRYGVRVGACGPPRAALVVLTDDDV